VNALGDNQERKPLLNGKISTQHSNESNQPTPSSLSSETVLKSTFRSRLTRLKELLPFLGVFAPLIVFWAIFYQQNSTWILQGAQMNCHLGKLQVPPGE
jgi:dipeptide/tripeptide permease